VAELGPDDTMDSLIQRADAGLYEAKHLGRDRVCSA
jgi:PleD family two-component response regulator